MKKTIFILSIFVVLLFTGCKNNLEEDKYQELTLINNTNLMLKYSVINGTSSATTSSAFYAQSHSYLTDYVGTVMKKQLLSPSGHKSGDLMLDRQTYKCNKGNYNVTLFVCKSNTYTNQDDVYINKYTFNFSGNKTVTIGSDGKIY